MPPTCLFTTVRQAELRLVSKSSTRINKHHTVHTEILVTCAEIEVMVVHLKFLNSLKEAISSSPHPTCTLTKHGGAPFYICGYDIMVQ